MPMPVSQMLLRHRKGIRLPQRSLHAQRARRLTASDTTQSVIGVIARAPRRGKLHSAHKVDDEKKDQNGSKNAATDIHLTLR